MTGAIDAALRISLVLLIGLAAAGCCRRRSAALRHAVLVMALAGAAAVVPLGLVMPALVMPALPASWPAPPTTPARPPARLGSASEATATSRDGSRTAAGPAVGNPARTTAASWVRNLSPHAVLLVIWATGSAIGLAWLGAALVRLARVTARAAPVDAVHWRACVAEVSARYRLTRGVVVLGTDRPGLLATWGVRRPRILVPTAAAAWPDDRVRALLLHELAHVARWDWPVQLWAETLRALLWWNPLAWLICHRLRLESEQACDDAVLGAGMSGPRYAETLIGIARDCRVLRLSHAVVPMARSSTLERRIVAMLNPALDRARPSRSTVVLAASGVLAIVLGAAALGRAQTRVQPLEGVVYDATGAVLPSVALSLAREGRRVEAVTDSAGRFTFADVDAGRYLLEARLPGFRLLHQPVDLQEDADWDRAVTLQVGVVQETITVQESRLAPAGTPASGPERVRVGGNIRPPRKLQHVKPVYPASMREAGREGVVPLEAIIGQDGRVHSVSVVSAQVHPDLGIAAADAVRQWRFAPTLLNGSAVEVVMTVTVAFKLQ